MRGSAWALEENEGGREDPIGRSGVGARCAIAWRTSTVLREVGLPALDREESKTNLHQLSALTFLWKSLGCLRLRVATGHGDIKVSNGGSDIDCGLYRLIHAHRMSSTRIVASFTTLPSSSFHRRSAVTATAPSRAAIVKQTQSPRDNPRSPLVPNSAPQNSASAIPNLSSTSR